MKIVIEGNINSGKTTLINYLKSEIQDIKVIDSGSVFFSSDDNYNIIKLAEEEPLKWTFLKQLTFMKFLNHVQNKDEEDVRVFSRSLFSAHHVFNKSLKTVLTEEEYVQLENEYENLLENEKDIDLLVMITSKPEELKKRTMDKTCANNIDLYHEHYDKIVELIKAKNTIVIDSSKSLDSLTEDYKKIRDFIINKKFSNSLNGF